MVKVYPARDTITLTKQPPQVDTPPALLDAGEDGAPVHLTARQMRDGREALRDWLASGKDSLNVTRTSLDMGVLQLVSAVIRREVLPEPS